MIPRSLLAVNVDFCFSSSPDRFLRSHLPQSESVFRGRFRVLSGDFLPAGPPPEPGSHAHKQKAGFYQHKLDLVMSGSPLAREYVRSEVFLVEG